MSSSQQELQSAYELIKSGQRLRAVAILQAVVEREPQNADAWWLMANAVEDVQDRRNALLRVLQINSTHSGAQRMLDDLANVPAVNYGGERFSDLGSGVAAMPPQQPVIVTQQKKGGCSIVTILIVLGMIMCAACAVCAVITMNVSSQFGEILNAPGLMETIMSDPEIGPALEQLATELATQLSN